MKPNNPLQKTEIALKDARKSNSKRISKDVRRLSINLDKRHILWLLLYYSTFQFELYTTVKIYKSRKGLVWWRTRDSMSYGSQWSDSWQNQGVSPISLLFKILMVVKYFKINLAQIVIKPPRKSFKPSETSMFIE